MATAISMEDGLRHSIGKPHDESNFDGFNGLDARMIGENEDAFAANNQLLNGVAHSQALQMDSEDQESPENAGYTEGDEDDGEADAEGEEDDVDVYGVPIHGSRGPSFEHDEDDSEGDNEEDEEDEEGVGAVKIQPGLEDAEGEEEDEEEEDIEDDDDDEEDSDAGDVDNASEASTVAASEIEREWEAQAADEEEDGKISASTGVDPNGCVFCGKDEKNVPSTDFGEYLACAVCGDNAHEHCARAANLKVDHEVRSWRCKDCVDNSLQPEIAMADPNLEITTRRSSAPKLARDLLPSSRGSIKPDSYSVFNTLIAPDDPMNGSRMLRKRKTTSPEADESAQLPKRNRNDSESSSYATASMNGGKLATTSIPEAAEHEHNVVFDLALNSTSPRPSRALRPKSSVQPHATIVKSSRTSTILELRVDPVELSHILSQAPKPKKKRRPAARSRSIPNDVHPAQTFPYSLPFFSFHDREMDEVKSKPYGGVLTDAEADQSKSRPSAEDNEKFLDAKHKSELDWSERLALAAAEASPIKRTRKISGPASQIECIQFGSREIDTWYAAPYPEEYSRNRVLFICEFCLKYMNSDYVAWRHKLKCSAKHPPGDEIYRDRSRDGAISIFEVDGRKNPVYCQNLCLLAKLFLGSKTLYYDVEPFLFYVMTEFDEFGYHFIGYFSKEKRPSSQNNVSCILTLPIHQRKGYGNLLIDFSYLLTRVEQKCGSPEKPLSDMGLVSYRNYWRLALCYHFRNHQGAISISTISAQTGMTADDIVSACEALSALVRDPITGSYAFRFNHEIFEDEIARWEKKAYIRLNPKALVWTPYIMGRQNTSIIEHGPPMTAIEQRGDDENDHLISGEAIIQRQTNGLTSDIELDINGHSAMKMEDSANPVYDDKTTDREDLLRVLPMGKGPQALMALSLNEVPVPSPDFKQRQQAPEKSNGYYDPEAPDYIPPTRFQVYPPVVASRRGNARPGIGRSASSISRNRNGVASTARKSGSRRRTNGYSTSRRRSTAYKSRSTARRNGSESTGRGPGRWPKGTKKSDFGNAESGPGLPSRSVKSRSKLEKEITLDDDDDEEEEEEEEQPVEDGGDDSEDEDVEIGDEEEEDDEVEEDEDEEDDDDAILYETPAPRSRRLAATLGRSKGRGKLFVKGTGKGSPSFESDEEEDQIEDDDEGDDDEDVIMHEGEFDVGDLDAEGEDE